MFKDYIAVVTGASSGIGLATVRQFIENGATVIGVDCNTETLKKVDAELGERFVAKLVDVSKEDQIITLAKFVEETYGRVDGLLNVAGVIKFGVPLYQITDEDFDSHFHVNVKGPMFMAKHFIPLLKKSSNASIVNVTSTVVHQELPNHSLYSTSKAALEKLTWHLVKDFPGIRSNTILPGWTMTPMAEGAGSPEELKLIFDLMAEKWIPAGRVAQPDDMANVMLFLCSEKASYVNGASITVDGGYTRNASWGM
jgi:NAD(P)-dependent dehydrogenase (short-subunit alcohol dehydrogenase family)